MNLLKKGCKKTINTMECWNDTCYKPT